MHTQISSFHIRPSCWYFLWYIYGSKTRKTGHL